MIQIAYQLLNNLLDEFTERIGGMLYPEMVNQFGDNFGIGITFEHVSSLLQQSFHFLIIRHDTCIQIVRKKWKGIHRYLTTGCIRIYLYVILRALPL